MTPNDFNNFVLIKGGSFLMGSPDDEPERYDIEGPQHQVTVSGFYMGKYPVTQREYEAVIGKNPSRFKNKLKRSDLPVEWVSWYEAVEYCNRRSEGEGLSPAYTIKETGSDRKILLVTWDRKANGYRLPTEAEWEYACRAGTTTPFNTGDNITTDQANYDGNYPYNNNAKGEYRRKTTHVGIFPPNSWGLYDMHGNVIEWCWDRYGAYANNAETNPTGASSGLNRVGRGGGWMLYAKSCRSADRASFAPSTHGDGLGFRVVRSLE